MSISTDKNEAAKNWTTEDELQYLRSIGQWQAVVQETWYGSIPSPMPSTVQMLRNYIAAAEYRSDWGQIDRQQVLDCAAERLIDLAISRPEKQAILLSVVM